MGYSEVLCQLCGVSFNIGRIRSLDEVRGAAPKGMEAVALRRLLYNSECSCASRSYCVKGGCMVKDRPSRVRRPDDSQSEEDYGDESDATRLGHSDMDLSNSDFDYLPVEPGSDPYELHTPQESELGDSDVDMMDDGENDSDAALEALDSLQLPESSVIEDPTLKTIRPQENVEDLDSYYLEHIAGPGCSHELGYDGQLISLEEMRGCCTAQFLVPKPNWWRPEPDDESFEVEGDFFLSGLTDHMPSRDENRPTVFPDRHGCSSPEADNTFFAPEMANDTAMPFHPTCLEVYKRASVFRFGKVDFKDLLDWFRHDGAYDVFQSFDRVPAVKLANEQWWRHVAGDEYLAANPCFVPVLREILVQILLSHMHESAAPDPHRDAFTLSGTTTATLPNDYFTRFPLELRLDVISHLASQDLANLRLASRTFRQLPQSLFHTLIVREQPWLWEAWCTIPYACWATTTAAKLKEENKEWQSKRSAIQRSIEILVEEGEPHGENLSAIEALRARLIVIEEEERLPRRPVEADQLPKGQTDWYGVYLSISRRRNELKGLQNRERIWKDCNTILDRISELRTEGKIRPGLRIDARLTSESYYARTGRGNLG